MPPARWVVAALAAAVIAGTPGSVRADPAVFVGGSIGRGQLDIDVDCGSCDSIGRLNEALSLSAHAGVLVAPRVGLLADMWMVRFKERDTLRFADSSDHLIAERVALASAQVWLSRLWLRPGIGIAWHQTDLHYPVSDRPVAFAAGSSMTVEPETTEAGGIAPAAGLAVGFELVRTPGFGFELVLRAAAAPHDGDVRVAVGAIAIGGTWY